MAAGGAIGATPTATRVAVATSAAATACYSQLKPGLVEEEADTSPEGATASTEETGAG